MDKTIGKIENCGMLVKADTDINLLSEYLKLTDALKQCIKSFDLSGLTYDTLYELVYIRTKSRSILVDNPDMGDTLKCGINFVLKESDKYISAYSKRELEIIRVTGESKVLEDSRKHKGGYKPSAKLIKNSEQSQHSIHYSQDNSYVAHKIGMQEHKNRNLIDLEGHKVMSGAITMAYSILAVLLTIAFIGFGMYIEILLAVVIPYIVLLITVNVMVVMRNLDMNHNEITYRLSKSKRLTRTEMSLAMLLAVDNKDEKLSNELYKEYMEDKGLDLMESYTKMQVAYEKLYGV